LYANIVAIWFVFYLFFKLNLVDSKFHKYAQVCDEEPQMAALSIGRNNLNNNVNESKKVSVVKQASFGVYSRKSLFLI
jgi:hypothetical protein